MVSIVACWIPQTFEVVKVKRSRMNYSFLVLYLVGSIALTIYAIGDLIFVILNLLAALGSAINLYYKAFPKELEKK